MLRNQKLSLLLEAAWALFPNQEGAFRNYGEKYSSSSLLFLFQEQEEEKGEDKLSNGWNFFAGSPTQKTRSKNFVLSVKKQV